MMLQACINKSLNLPVPKSKTRLLQIHRHRGTGIQFTHIWMKNTKPRDHPQGKSALIQLEYRSMKWI